MKRSEPLWKRKLAKKMLADQRLWDKLQSKEQRFGTARFEEGVFYAPYIPLMKSGSFKI